MLDCKIYPHESLISPSKEAIILSCTRGNTALGKQGVTDYKSITIKRGGEEMQKHTYILILNKALISKEIRIRYNLEKVEQYIPKSFRYFKCQKYRHHKENLQGYLTFEKYGQKCLDHMEEDCSNETAKRITLNFK